MIDHPLAPPGRPEIPGTSNVPIRYRPRFTMGEALLLNLLVNAHPGWVSLEEITQQIARFSRSGQPSRGALMVRVCALRAKIGDPAWKPVQIVSVKQRFKVGNYECDRLVGYYWNDPEHPRSIKLSANEVKG